MAGIPSSAIKIYTAASGGTEVTTAGVSGTAVYARIPASFTETLTGASKTVAFPYYGRVLLDGTKAFNCNGDTKNLTVQIPAYAVNHNTAGSMVGLSTCTVTAGTATYTYTSGTSASAACTKGAQSFTFTLYSNSADYWWDELADAAWLTINSVTANAQNVPEVTTTAITSDIGRVNRYAIVISCTVTANTALPDRSETIVMRFNGGVDEVSITLTQASEGVLLSVSSVSVDSATGLSATAITVTSDTTFTIS